MASQAEADALAATRAAADELLASAGCAAPKVVAAELRRSLRTVADAQCAGGGGGGRVAAFAWREGSAWDASARAEALEAWLPSAGIDCGGIVHPRGPDGLKSGGGCGVFLDEGAPELPPNTVVCEVPRQAMINSGARGRGPMLRALAAALPIVDAVPSLGLTLRLLQECHRARASPWRAYIHALPPPQTLAAGDPDVAARGGAFGVPLMFSDDALEVIEGSAAGVAVRRHWADFARQYCMCAEAAADENVVKGVPLGKRWPLLWDEFLWAAAIVMTRQNPLPDDSAAASASASVEAAAGPGELALMPLLDYHNHAPAEAGGGSVAYDPERRAANVALGSHGGKPGEEVAICYGQRPSDHLFLYGGFMADVKAEHDRVRLHVAFPFKYDDDKVRARFHAPMRVSFPSLRARALTKLGNRVRALARSRCARLRVRPLEQKRPFEGLCQALQVPTEGALEIGGTGRPRAELSRWLTAAVAAAGPAEAAVEKLRAIVAARASGSEALAELCAVWSKSAEAAMLATLCRGALGSLSAATAGRDSDGAGAAWDVRLARQMVRRERALLERAVAWAEEGLEAI